MAKNSFTLGDAFKYEASGRMVYNGVDGVLWVKRVKCADGSGWLHDGKVHLPLRATRRQVTERFGQIFRSELVKPA